MNDIRPSQFPNQRWPVQQLGCHRARVLDIENATKRSGGTGVDWNEIRSNLRVIRPSTKQAVRLDGLASKNSHRRSNDCDVHALLCSYHSASAGSSANDAPVSVSLCALGTLSADFCLVSRRVPVPHPCRFPLCEPARPGSQLSGLSLHPGLADWLRMRCVFRTNG